MVDDTSRAVLTFSPDPLFLVYLTSKQDARIIRLNGDRTDLLKIVIKGSQIQVKFFAGDLDERADEAVIEIVWVLNDDFAPDRTAVSAFSRCNLTLSGSTFFMGWEMTAYLVDIVVSFGGVCIVFTYVTDV